MRRYPVKSTSVRSIGYDEANWLLQVEFVGGATYNYFRVPPKEHAKLCDAASIGTYMNREIKRYYHYEEVETERA